VEEALATPPSGGIDFRPLSFKEAQALARQEGKPLLVTCGFSLYASSQRLSRHVFPKRRVGDYCNPRFICVHYDMDTPEGKKLQKRFDIPLVEPSTILLAPDGSILLKYTGATTADEWLATIRAAIPD
jgi:uncharacterized protein YyaL (SSP411 family)